MSYHIGFGDVAAPVPATAVAPRERSSNKQAIATMVVTALPWIPVAVGAWIGGHYDKRGWGAAAGLAVSFLSLRYIDKQMAGNVT